MVTESAGGSGLLGEAIILGQVTFGVVAPDLVMEREEVMELET